MKRSARLPLTLSAVKGSYCGAGAVGVAEADGDAPAEDGFTDRIHAMIFHMSSSDLTMVPIGGIGPTTFSEPLRL